MAGSGMSMNATWTSSGGLINNNYTTSSSLHIQNFDIMTGANIESDLEIMSPEKGTPAIGGMIIFPDSAMTQKDCSSTSSSGFMMYQYGKKREVVLVVAQFHVFFDLLWSLHFIKEFNKFKEKRIMFDFELQKSIFAYRAGYQLSGCRNGHFSLRKRSDLKTPEP